jgi:hypothetical protein
LAVFVTMITPRKVVSREGMGETLGSMATMDSGKACARLGYYLHRWLALQRGGLMGIPRASRCPLVRWERSCVEAVVGARGSRGRWQYSAWHTSVVVVGEARTRGSRAKSVKRERRIVKE